MGKNSMKACSSSRRRISVNGGKFQRNFIGSRKNWASSINYVLDLERVNTSSHQSYDLKHECALTVIVISVVIGLATRLSEEQLLFAHLKVYDGIQPPYDKIKRMVIPNALKVLRLQTGHKYCLLGRLSSKVGWNHYDTIRELEKKRKERAQATYDKIAHQSREGGRGET